jgi:CHASE2 domain-containing sensor protein
MIDYALGPDYAVIPLKRLLETRDDESLGRLFQGRVVFLARVSLPEDRVTLAAPLAAWEPSARNTAAVLGHAQTLRTALHGRPVREAPLPLVVALIASAALLSRVPRRAAFAGAGLALATALVGSMLLLRFGFHIPVAAALATIALAPIAARRLG